jgi:glucan phosphoethanolaminetransferase (alkaline phosphatase superfamily)
MLRSFSRNTLSDLIFLCTYNVFFLSSLFSFRSSQKFFPGCRCTHICIIDQVICLTFFTMKTLIQFVLAACLTLAFSFLPGKVFSQEGHEHEMGSATTETDGTSSYVTGITTGRARSLVGVALGLTSLIIGWRAKARSVVSPSGRKWNITALVLGLVAVVLSVMHLATFMGGFGTGGGKAGAIVALVLGLIGMALSGRALLIPKKVE